VTQVPTSEILGASENQMRYFFTNGRDWIKRSKRYHSQSVKTRPERTIWKKKRMYCSCRLQWVIHEQTTRRNSKRLFRPRHIFDIYSVWIFSPSRW